jgi:hypothetical protein
MAIKPYRTWAMQFVPTWLRGEWSDKLVRAVTLPFDMLSELSHNAGASSYFLEPEFAPDALPYLGRERLMPRYPAESRGSYKARLHGAWDAWAQAGTIQGMLAQLSAWGVTAEIKEMWDWNWDGDYDNWSRFWVVIHEHPWGEAAKWGEFVYGDGTTYGSSATASDVDSVRSLIRKWKPAHMVCENIIIVLDADGWPLQQPDGTWDEPANRNPAAVYWDG